ncbi:MAG: hypothetical protein J1F66_04965 [Clostridiales bacterium]|nr:hypothetical protein [Clostridiales bacterium]
MKRFFVTIILTAVIAGVLTHFMPRDFEAYFKKFDCDAIVAIYCRQTELDGIDMGGGYKVTCEVAAFSDTVSKCSGIDGVSVSFTGAYEDVVELCNFFRLQVSSVYEQDGLYVVCGRSSKITKGVLDGGDVVNLQIAYKDGTVHIGSPLILGDY